MAAKNRTIYFYEPHLKDKNDNLKVLPKDFWTVLWDQVSALPGSTYQFVNYGKTYLIQARVSKSPAAKYFYFGKSRSQEDWPDVHNQQNISGLADIGLVGNLVESAYLTPAGIGLVAAIARTSGGPTTSSIAKGIDSLMKNLPAGDELSLVAYVRRDQFERLNKAIGVSKIGIKVAPDTDAQSLVQDGNDLGATIASVKHMEGDDAMSVEMNLSFGSSIPSLPVMQRLASMFKEIAGSEEQVDLFDKATATVITEGDSGKFKRESIDLISDRITMKGSFSTNSDEQPKPEQVVQALLVASEELREKINRTR